MSIESELQEFRHVALEEQIRLNAATDPGEYSRRVIYEELDPMLASIVGSRMVALCGDIVVPAVDDRMYVHDLDRPRHVFGRANGVQVCKTEDYFPDVPAGHLSIGYCVYLGQINKVTILATQVSNFYAFGPIVSSWLEVPDLRVESEVTVMPAADDEVARRIKESVQGEKLDPVELTQIFDSLFDASDGGSQAELPLSVKFYLDYLNKVIGISDYLATIKAEEYYAVYNDGSFQSMVTGDMHFSGGLDFTRFDYLPQIRELCLVKTDEGSASDLYFPLSEITQAEFTVKSNADSI